MVRKGIKMHLYPGMAEEYEKRHNQLWKDKNFFDGRVNGSRNIDGLFQGGVVLRLFQAHDRLPANAHLLCQLLLRQIFQLSEFL